MKKTILFLLAVLAVVFSTSLYASSDKDRVVETRQLKGFERIRLLGSPNIKYTQGKTWSVRVEAPQNVIKYVDTHVDKDCLVVNMKYNKNITNFFNFRGLGNNQVVVYVTSPDLIGVEVQGSGDFECRSKVDTDNLNLSLRGSGDIKFSDIICDCIRTSVIGSGDMDIKYVEARNSEVELVGSGDVSIKQSKVGYTQIELKGSGDIKVNCDQCQVVNCQLVGSGDITLTGVVTQLNQTTRGSGDIYLSGLQIRK